MTDSELQGIINNLKTSLGNFTTSLDEVNQRARDMASGAKSAQEEFEDNLKKLGRWNKTTDELHKKQLQQQFSELQKAKDIEAKLHKEKEQVAEALRDLEVKIQKSADALKKAAADKAAGVAGAAAHKAAQDNLKRERQAKSAYNKQLNATNQELANATRTQSNIVGLMHQTEQDLKKFSWKDTGKQVGSKMGDAVKSGIKNVMSGLTVTNAVAGLYSGLTQVMATGGDNLYASLSQQFDVIKLGLTPEEYIKMNAASRQTILASGGVTTQMKILADQSDKLQGHFASVGDRTKYAQGQMDALALAGIRPTQESAGLLNKQMIRMKALTGMTGDQFTKLTEELATDQDIQSQLRSANMEEREQIMASVTARIAENRALGMTATQATAVAKSMAKMQGAKPLDRYVKGAKARALMNMMGIAGGEEAQRIEVLGKRASPEETKRLQELYSQVANKQARDQRNAPFAQELLNSLAQEKLGNEATAPNSEFNTNLSAALTISEKSLEEQKKVPELLQQLIDKFQILVAAKANPVVQAAGGAAGGVWDLFGSGATGAVGGWAASKFLGKAAPTVVPSGPIAPAAPSAAGGGSRFLRGAGGKMLGAAGAVGLSGYEAYDAYSEHEKGNISEKERNAKYGSAGGGLAGALAGAKLGAMGGGAVGTAFGGIGAVPGALVGGLVGGAAGYWGGSSAGEALGGMTGDDTKREQMIANAKAKAKAKALTPRSSTEEALLASKVQETLGDTTSKPSVAPPLTSAETRADTTSPFGLQLSKIDQSNDYLQDMVKLGTKQLELAEKQLAATIVSQDDKEKLYKSLASGNKFMTSYSTLA